jgi:DNA-binding XRE family transcriptional regulator
MMTRLKERREKTGLTQQDVADMLEVSRQTIAAWENGIKKVPRERQTQLNMLFVTFL